MIRRVFQLFMAVAVLILKHSDSLLADQPAVQCWTSGCVETTHNQVNQSKPSYPSLNQVNQTKPKSQAYANHGNHGDHLHSRKPWKHSNNRKSWRWHFFLLQIKWHLPHRNLGTPHKQPQHLRCDSLCPWSGCRRRFKEKATVGARMQSWHLPTQPCSETTNVPPSSNASSLPDCMLKKRN